MKWNNDTSFELIYASLLVEYILYNRDRNKKKDWGHVQWWTTIFSYTRYNDNIVALPVPKDCEKTKLFIFESIDFIDWNFTEEEVIFINTYFLFEDEKVFSKKIEKKDREVYPYISMILDWYHGNFERKILDKYKFDDYLYHFIYAISYNAYTSSDYYFRFSEMLDDVSYIRLLRSYSDSPRYLFTNIALASYFFNSQNHKKAYGFYKRCLGIDPDNPYVLGRLSLLCSCLPEKKHQLFAEKLSKSVRSILPESPWVWSLSADILNRQWKYIDSILCIEEYEYLTKGKYRTFEPFLHKAEAYVWLGDLESAKLEISKVDLYYFGKWYGYIYDDIVKNLEKFSQ